LIPKKIHYVWFGGSKGNLENICVNSWREKLPDYEIIEWNENNVDIEKEIKRNKFLEECYKRKLWAFISDYIRIKALFEHGGVYMDTDMQILKDVTPLLDEYSVFFGYENEKYVSAGIIGGKKGHQLFKDILDFYNNEVLDANIFTIPKIITHILETKYQQVNKNLYSNDIYVYDKEYFYPFYYNEDFEYSCIKENTYGIHWWSKSWGKKRDYFLETKHLKGAPKLIKYSKIFIKNNLIKGK